MREATAHDVVATSLVGDRSGGQDVGAKSRTIAAKMPSAGKVSDGPYEGYAYSIHNDFGDTYELFIYHDPSYQGYQGYRVTLGSPTIGEELGHHSIHINPGGTPDLPRHDTGQPSIEQTYAQSVLTALSVSQYRHREWFQNYDSDKDQYRA